MKRCWHQDPMIRPTAADLCEIFKSWRDDEQVISNLDKLKPNIDSVYQKLDTTGFISSRLLTANEYISSREQDITDP